MNPALKEELRLQRRTVFGHRRYWFHIVLWVVALIASYPYSDDFSKGFQVGVNIVKKTSADSTAAGRSDSIVVIRQHEDAPIGISADLNKAFLDQPVLMTNAAISVAVAALIVYSILLIVIPYARYRQQKRVLAGAVLLIILLFITAVLGTSTVMGLMASGRSANMDMMPLMHLMLSSMLVLVITVSFFSFYYFIDLYDQQRALDRYQKVFAAKMLAETSFLKMQINPHFLFNSLNNIYALTLNQSPQAPVIAGKLRELVSYMLNECTQETVPVAGELSFLRNYIALEQLRNQQEQVRISYDVRGAAEGLQIAPLLLVNFIENAFKHGVKAGIDQAEVRVRVDLVGSMLSLEVFNTKPAATIDPAQTIREAGGIGIRNVKRRLQILYPHRHTLKISDTAAGYTVHLNVTL